MSLEPTHTVSYRFLILFEWPALSCIATLSHISEPYEPCTENLLLQAALQHLNAKHKGSKTWEHAWAHGSFVDRSKSVMELLAGFLRERVVTDSEGEKHTVGSNELA